MPNKQFHQACAPERSPYFSLPNITNSSESGESHTVRRPIESPFKQSEPVAAVFGKVNKMSDQQQTGFLMQLIFHSTFEPNFQRMAETFNFAGGTAVQRRFESIALRNGFAYKDGKLVPQDKNASSQKADLGLVRSQGGSKSGGKRKRVVAQDAEGDEPEATKTRKTMSDAFNYTDSTPKLDDGDVSGAEQGVAADGEGHGVQLED